MIKNAYIHIPFCKSKCNYCSFTSFEKLDLIDKYFETLKAEIKHFYNGENLNTIYFGGGTPSLCKSEQLKEILSLMNYTNEAEITLECNPNDVSVDYLTALKTVGFNRISFGVQTFDDEILKFIGRRHTAAEAKNAVNTAKLAGFENISIDLIYGLPNQTIDGFKKDLEDAISLDIQHISFYGLKIDIGCKFYKNMPENLPNSDLQADMYEYGCKFLKEKNFEHYEISNFAKNGLKSRHNLIYWDNNSYYGFGVAAHGFDGENRYANISTIEKYIENPYEKEEINKLSYQENLEDEIFLALRKASGLNVSNINQKFNIDFEKKYAEILKKYSEYLLKVDDNYKLTENGFLISNEIMSEFID